MGVAIHGEAVIGAVDPHVTRDTAETKHGEQSVMIVWLHNWPNIEDGSLVLIIGAHRVQGVRISDLSVRGGVVDSDSEGDFPACA